MLITTTQIQARIPVSVMHLHGDMDASNYTKVIKKAQEIYDGGARDLILDLSKVPYLSSAGLMALHTTALVFAGQSVKIESSGRPVFRALDPTKDSSARQHVKLVNPQPQVNQVIQTVGLKQFFEVFSDLGSALNSF
jgi:anti-anti-sigma factor